MKKIILITLLLFTLLFVGCRQKEFSPDTENSNEVETAKQPESSEQPAEENEIIEEKTDVINYKNIKAIWLSQFDLYNVYTDSGTQRKETDFTQKIKTIIGNIKKYGFNTVILQIRPNADSFYPSDIYPPSKYVTGNYSNPFSFDPLPCIINEAHKADLSVQAWINPLRCMNEDEIVLVDNKYQIKKWYNSPESNGSFLVLYNNKYYLNPAYESVRNMIVDGVDEILSKYDFDGIHMDDYFYPTTEAFFDQKAYNDYLHNTANITLKEFRHKMLNSLIFDIYNTVKLSNEQRIFGVSPAGNLESVVNDSFADVYTWCENEGYIDYISPQIYFGLEHQTHPFDKTTETWANIIKSDKIKLVVGITLGKAYSKEDKWAGTGKTEWAKNNDIVKRCLEYTKTVNKCSGVSFFSYQYFFDAVTNIQPAETKKEIENMLPVLYDISWQ